MEQVYGLKNFTPAWKYDYDNSFFVGGARSYRLLGNA